MNIFVEIFFGKSSFFAFFLKRSSRFIAFKSMSYRSCKPWEFMSLCRIKVDTSEISSFDRNIYETFFILDKRKKIAQSYFSDIAVCILTSRSVIKTHCFCHIFISHYRGSENAFRKACFMCFFVNSWKYYTLTCCLCFA